jgi:hypothetical protein
MYFKLSEQFFDDEESIFNFLSEFKDIDGVLHELQDDDFELQDDDFELQDDDFELQDDDFDELQFDDNELQDDDNDIVLQFDDIVLQDDDKLQLPNLELFKQGIEILDFSEL